MSQKLVTSWTNPATAVARNESTGFTVAEAKTVNVTDGGQFYWNSSMPDGYYLDVDAGTIGTSNGFTPYTETAQFGAAISGFTNAANGVITASNIAAFGFAAGDTITVGGVADDGTGTSLNGTWTVSSVTATTITLNESTAAPTYSVYVSGGVAVRVSDTNGDAIPTENIAIRGITVGTSVVGTDADDTVAVFDSEEPVT